jgi:hypothetical protein
LPSKKAQHYGGGVEADVTDAAYKNAMAKRDALVRELERVDMFLELYKEFAPTNYDDSGAASISVEPTKRGNVTARIVDAAESVIRAAGKPVSRADILKALEDQGIPVGGKDPGATLASALWRDRERFVSIKGYGYWLRQVSYADAFYDPKIEEVMGVTEGYES